MNIIISGWAGAGSSTAARIITILLERKYWYSGGVLKEWGKRMGYDTSSNEISKWQDRYGDDWDYIWENYMQQRVKSIENAVIDTKILGFFSPKGQKSTRKIFIKASLAARNSRARSDKREESLAKRDKEDQLRWEKTFGIDFFSEEDISQSYDFVLDTTKIGIYHVAKAIIDYLHKEKIIDKFKLYPKLDTLMSEFNRNPDILKTKIKEMDLFVTPEQIFKEWRSSKYKKLLTNIPEEMKIVL